MLARRANPSLGEAHAFLEKYNSRILDLDLSFEPTKPRKSGYKYQSFSRIKVDRQRKEERRRETN
jgi:hypothetical protein